MERPLESVEDLEGMEKLMERSLESVEDLEGVKGPAEGSEAALLLAPAGAALLGLEELELPCEAAAAALGGGLRVKGPAESSESSEAALLLVPTGMALLGLKELERPLERHHVRPHEVPDVRERFRRGRDGGLNCAGGARGAGGGGAALAQRRGARGTRLRAAGAGGRLRRASGQRGALGPLWRRAPVLHGASPGPSCVAALRRGGAATPLRRR